MTKRTERAQRTQAKNGAGAALAHLVEPMLAGMTTRASTCSRGSMRTGGGAGRVVSRGGRGAGGPKAGIKPAHHHHWARRRRSSPSAGGACRCAVPACGRRAAGSDVALGGGVRDRDPLTARMMQQLLVGVSMRDYDGSLEARPSGRRTRGSSKSAVSRTVVRRTRQRLHEHLARRLDGLEVVALFMDGLVWPADGDRRLAITRDGGKVPLGLRLGSTETPWCARSCCRICSRAAHA